MTPIAITPASGALGAEITGMDSQGSITDEELAILNDAFLMHRVLFFRDLDLTPGQLTSFGQRFGILEDYPFVQPLAGHPKVIAVIKEPLFNASSSTITA